MTPARSITIVGGGVAAFATAGQLRQHGFDGTVTIIEPGGLPYDRPPLTKGYLTGSVDAPGLTLASEAWYADNAIRLVDATATALQPALGRIELDTGTELASDIVVFATGARPRVLPVAGATLPGVLYLRTRVDADRLSAHLSPGRHLAIIGAGLIGAEVASSARRLGVEVTLIDPLGVPLSAAFGSDLATTLHHWHTLNGVATVQGNVHQIERLRGRLSLTVQTAPTPRKVVADAVLVAIGSMPDTTLASAAGLDVSDGIIVDGGRRTSHPKVFAVGDCSRKVLGNRYLRREEHWDAALTDGRVAAACILGLDLPPESPSWFWTDRYGMHVEVLGHMTDPGTTTVHRAYNELRRAVFRLDEDDRLVGTAAIDSPLDIKAARRLLARGTPVSALQLSDPAVPLRNLAR
ncbi:MAG: FAD-dependent oxidoreductase [Actinobacteria bacterium]|nr:FAD-dependent oxidoreductase [Actinomycetota bacterium]